MMKNENYTEENIAYIKEIAHGRSVKEISKMYNKKFGQHRTTTAIGMVMRRNKITTGKKFTEAEIEYLRTCVGKFESVQALTDSFNAKFGTNRNKGAIAGAMNRRGFTSGIQEKKNYTEEQIEYLREMTPGRSYKEIHRLFNQTFKTNRSFDSVKSTISEKGMKNGIDERYKSGNIPYNHYPVGTEKLTSDGYLRVKVAEPNHWVFKHRMLWEKENGPIPSGCCLLFADGNKQNVQLDNIILVSRGELGQMNKMGYIFDNGDLTKTAHLLTKLKLKEYETLRRLRQ